MHNNLIFFVSFRGTIFQKVVYQKNIICYRICIFTFQEEYILLCGSRPGLIMNPMTNRTEEIDECALMPNMCNHGTCVNTPGSFHCSCDSGYVYDGNSHQCIGKPFLFPHVFWDHAWSLCFNELYIVTADRRQRVLAYTASVPWHRSVCERARIIWVPMPWRIQTGTDR